MAYRNIILLLATLLLCFGLGWWLGSRKEPIEVVREKVRYVKGDTTSIYIDRPIVKYIRVHDTIIVREEKRIPIPADTASIIADYIKQREYDLDFSTDTTGTFKVRAVVSHNRLASASATIAPLQREVENTVVKVHKFQPFVSGGVAIGDKVGASLGGGGIIKEKQLPSPGALSISTCALCRRAACLTMESPNPVPPTSLEWLLSTR